MSESASESAAEVEAESRDDTPKTEAQAEQAGETTQKPSDEARKIAREDAIWRAENPDKPRVREASEGVGGESFAYLDVVSGG